jgi:BioD-like phosphotransacetylase family protein
MAALYVASWAEGAGKTALCIGMARWLHKNGKAVGYLKPLALADSGDGRDAGFVRQTLGLADTLESISPRFLNRQDFAAETSSGRLGEKVKKAYSEVGSRKDVVLVEGAVGLGADADVAESSYQIVEALDAKVIIVVAHEKELPWDKIASQAGRFGQRLLGIVINRVPQNKVESVRSGADRPGAAKGVKILGVLAEDRAMLGVSVAEIAEKLKAKALCCTEGLGDMVENVMVGALTPDSGADYFDRKDNKVAIARGERPDMQLAALATSTRCLVLTGGVEPIGQVLSFAEDKGAPILLTEKDTLSAVADVEQAFTEAKFRHRSKLEALDSILEQGLDFASLSEGLRLPV